MTYFPIPGEGAWVLLSEFCQTKQGEEHYVHSTERRSHVHRKTQTYVYILVWKVSRARKKRKKVPLSVL